MPNESSTQAAGIRAPADLNPRTDPPLDFPDADFGTLQPADYETLGFMAGLEVHQQLLTRSKLFCRCRTGRYPTHYDASVLRHMRPTLSELGEYDGTALMEFKTRKEIVYRLERESVCTYEMDDTPPFEMDEEAIQIAVEVAQLLDVNLVSELHVMRKQYLDGSIPTGFQRTAMVGLDGSVPFVVPELGVDRTLRIRQLSLEEDSCREVSDIGHRITFSTGRLGMPLIEMVTEPEFRTPTEVEAGGKLLADVARATGKVRRGSGAARQDVNVSIAGGRRVEIKGVHRHRGLAALVHVEAFRQLNLLRIRAELLRRGVQPEAFQLPGEGRPWDVSDLVADVTTSMRSSGAAGLLQALGPDHTVCAARLPAFAGLLGHRTQPGLVFAHELSERVRVIACPSHQPFLTHSESRDGQVSEGSWDELRSVLSADADDAIVLVWASADDAATAARELLLRAGEALNGVPPETRQANGDGTTGFERVLPGPDRMYPDTDTPPIALEDDMVTAIRAGLPETPWSREGRYLGLGLPRHLARALARSSWADLFDGAAPPEGDVARRLAWTLLKRMPHHRRRSRLDLSDEPARLAPMVGAIAAGRVRPEALDRMVDAAILEPHTPCEDIVSRFGPATVDPAELSTVLDEAANQANSLEGRAPDTKLRWAMGKAMSRLLGRAEPRQVEGRLADLVGATTLATAS